MTASRSVQCFFNNDTDETLVRGNPNLEHGEWTILPPEKIEPRSTGQWGSESDGFATGTAGTVPYFVDGETTTVHWDDPYAGSNGANIDAPVGYDGTASIDSGDNTTAHFLIQKSSS